MVMDNNNFFTLFFLVLWSRSSYVVLMSSPTVFTYSNIRVKLNDTYNPIVNHGTHGIENPSVIPHV